MVPRGRSLRPMPRRARGPRFNRTPPGGTHEHRAGTGRRDTWPDDGRAARVPRRRAATGPPARAGPRGHLPRGHGARDVGRPRHPARLRPRGLRRHGRGCVRLLPAVRGDGPQGHRPGHGDLRHLPGQRPDPGRGHRGAEAALAGRDRRGRHRLRLRRHRARGGLRPRRDEDPRRPDRGGRRAHRLPDQRRQAVDLQRLHRRCHHDPGPGPRRAHLVRRRARHTGVHQRQARGQARHPAVEHRGTVPRRRRGAGRATSSAASRATASCRPSRSSATPA